MEIDVPSSGAEAETGATSAGEVSDAGGNATSAMDVDAQSDDEDAEEDGNAEADLDESAEIISSSPVKACEENGSVGGSSDIEEIVDAKSNGHNSSNESSPTKDQQTPKKKKKQSVVDLSITPRRSSRNVNRKSYTERETEDDGIVIDNNSDIEEIKPEDPLAEVDSKDKENSKLKAAMKGITASSKNTIVVNDTKRLVEIAAGSKNMKGGKKEPTLVIIDTNSILSGKGGIPVSSSHRSSHHHQSSSSSSSSSSFAAHLPHGMTASSSLSVTPIGVSPTQLYNSRTTITPVPMKTAHLNSSKSTTITPVPMNPMHHSPMHHQQNYHHHPHHHQQQQPPPQPPPPQILPTLTDDMFVVEAPSFIVPYVYEKPPIKPLKEFSEKLGKCIKEFDASEKVRKAAEKEKRKAEGKEPDDDDDDDSDLEETPPKPEEEKSKNPTYFDLPLGKFFMSIGVGLVQEYVQTDLLRTQKRKQGKGSTSVETQMAINSLIKNLEFSKENNEPFHFELKKCEFCSFRTESSLAMQHHLETPHMHNYAYKCNYCPIEVRSPHDILYHMEAEHNIRGRLERGPAFHQCPNCPFEDNQKGKLSRHILACQKKFRPERNLEPSMDWEPPAKIPRMNRPRGMGPAPNPAALAAMAMASAKGPQPLLPKLLPAPVSGRGRGRPPIHPRYPDIKSMRPTGSPGNMRADMASMMYRQAAAAGLMMPNSYQFNTNQLFQVMGGSGTVMSALSGLSSSSSGSSGRPAHIPLVPNVNESQSRLLSSQNTSVTNAVKNPTAKLLSQPSISITPLPRTAPQPSAPGAGGQGKPGGKSTFVICEICDGYIKDLEQLRNHMQWIHKVKIHPKMIYNRPPLNCQKCQFRFFTDQGLERHLLGSHGLVTSSMQEAANKGKDAGRCPACGRVYQWKLLNHVARDHGMTLKPAHLSYKCTVCTATFGMYKQFENHVYSAHSVVAKRVMDKKSGSPSSPSSRSSGSDSLLKPLKINDEITIIPQPPKPANRPGMPQGRAK
ncbi:hypothetical protein QAD02_009671 [Eretmocerus hayati]|uniref:Uncharacterized protein n=1 Tax=Eretmocerus hayati TaxID=131215 RepID=A0ACC2NAP8_9HYME|nr:hypothetical protein QAD02_009671 [Eretmocerus hayati]